jgi:DnaJ homolog subfamily C member 9
MPSRKDEDIEVDNAPTEINPYHVLDIEPTATADQVKSAYRKAALRHHPDKAAPEDKEAAHTRFQEIAFAYAVLSDERRRKRYDATGSTAESLDVDGDELDWASFFRAQFEAVTEDNINAFAETYKGSDEEKDHVLKAYVETEGNMDRLYSCVMLSDMLEDEDRFRSIIDAAIEAGDVEAYKKYTHETEKSKKARMDRERKRKAKEAKEAEKAAKEMDDDPNSKKNRSKAKNGTGDLGDLAALIQQREKGRAEGFFDHLEAKYAAQEAVKGRGKGKKGAKRATPMDDEPSEEAFAKNRKARKADGGDATEGARRSKRSKA